MIGNENALNTFSYIVQNGCYDLHPPFAILMQLYHHSAIFYV